MTRGTFGHRVLRSPSVWIAVVLLALSVAATVMVGIELYRSTAIQTPYNRR